MSLSAKPYMPRWTKPSRVYPELLAWWRKVLDHISWHEGQHIKIQKTFQRQVEDVAGWQGLLSSRRDPQEVEADVTRAQDAFDSKDRSWVYPTYTGPGGFYGTT